MYSYYVTLKSRHIFFSHQNLISYKMQRDEADTKKIRGSLVRGLLLFYDTTPPTCIIYNTSTQ